jgi:hypothetical protein
MPTAHRALHSIVAAQAGGCESPVTAFSAMHRQEAVMLETGETVVGRLTRLPQRRTMTPWCLLPRSL